MASGGMAVAETAPVIEPATGKNRVADKLKPRTISARDIAIQQGYTGDPCGVCQHMTLVRNGACLKCMTCGSASGCS